MAAASRDAGNVWADLVIAMLAVNNYPLDKAFTRAEALQALGLFDPEKLARWDVSEITRRLGKGGYTRGPFITGILAERLAALGQFIATQGAASCEATLRTGSREAVSRLLLTVKGIGPTVLGHFLVLRGE